MSILYNIKPGLIASCDFDGLRQPEMIKKRPVVVLTPTHGGLVTVVACSGTPPSPPTRTHMKLNPKQLPKIAFFNGETWVKGDMIYRVSMERLDLYKLPGRGSDGKRKYHKELIGRESMKNIYGCVMHGLNLGHLSQHI